MTFLLFIEFKSNKTKGSFFISKEPFLSRLALLINPGNYLTLPYFGEHLGKSGKLGDLLNNNLFILSRQVSNPVY
jgi:hypothetical protein